MLRERSFQIRGKDVHLRELTDLIALRPSDIRSTRETQSGLYEDQCESSSRLKSEILDALAPGVSLPEVRAFEDNGWVFLRRDEAINLSGAVPEAKVFIKPGGRLALSLNRLVVKLHDDPQQEEANETLEPHGVRVLEKFTFSPGLFRVELTNQAVGDALDMANKLIASGLTEFAEPELLEVITGR